MEKAKKSKAIDRFLNANDESSKDKEMKIVLQEREGLIERIDRVLVTKDGKQLLREVY